MLTGREIARSVRDGVEEGLRERYAGSNPVKRGVVDGVYEGVTGRKLNLPKRRRPWSMRSAKGTPWSFRRNGRPRKLLARKPVTHRPARRRPQKPATHRPARRRPQKPATHRPARRRPQKSATHRPA